MFGTVTIPAKLAQSRTELRASPATDGLSPSSPGSQDEYVRGAGQLRAIDGRGQPWPAMTGFVGPRGYS